MIPQNYVMKILKSNSINAFGGINFVFEYFNHLNLETIFNSHLPKLAEQSTYSWKDVFYSLSSIYFCNGEYIEDLNSIIKKNINDNPYCNIASSDTVLKRLKELDEEEKTCRTKRGTVEHKYSTNNLLSELNIKILKKLGVFKAPILTLDYDNTIIFSEKKDCKMSYKRQPGYQPGICTINEKNLLYLENRNGNSDAKSFQHETLERMFEQLSKQGIDKITNFRADSASYQFDVIQLIEKKCNNFYISARNSYVEKYFTKVNHWEETYDSKGEKIWVGEINYIPFILNNRKRNTSPKEYRLIVKKKENKDKQIDLITQDNFTYTAIITNDKKKTAIEISHFYNQRGKMENIFDVLKNDFGWNNMPFSKLSSNHVFLYLTAMIKNLYNSVLSYFSKKTKGFIKPTIRMKRFVFKLIMIPAKWVIRSRQHQLRVFGELHFKT